MKLAWVATTGPEDWWPRPWSVWKSIADTYLSMNAPIQLAADVLLEQRKKIQPILLDRVRANLAELDSQMAEQKTLREVEVEGGWYAVLRVPVTQSDEDFAIDVLHETSVLIHPGHFYDFPKRRVSDSKLAYAASSSFATEQDECCAF